jgi:DNA-binding response OmpR family regulator
MGRIQEATEVFTYKWHPVILHAVYELEGGGYSELEAAVDGISSKMLSDGLADLRERDILETRETVEDSGRTVYVLSEKGRALVPALQMLDAWYRRYEERRPSVLILEDERMVATILAEYFTDSYDTRHVSTGHEAIEAHGEATDVVVVDRKLEGMSGDDAAERIREEDARQLVLCVSGIEPDDDVYELAYDDYVHKPVAEAEVRTRLELLLDRSGLEPPAREYLSLRSKQVALTEAHGHAATRMDGYRNCAERIEELDLPSEQKRTLEPLLPPAARDSSAVYE